MPISDLMSLTAFLSGFMMGGLVSPVTHGIKGGTTFLQGGHEFITDHKQYKKTKEAERLQFEHDAKLITETWTNIGEATTDRSFGFIKQSDLEEEINNAPAEELDLKAMVKEERAKIKTVSVESVKHGVRGASSFFRLVPYVFLVLGFISLENNWLLDIAIYLPSLLLGIIVGFVSSKELF